MKRPPLPSLIGLCSAFVTMSALAQTTYTWTGSAGDGTNLAVAVNWGGTLPSTMTADTAQWTGAVPGPLNLVYNNNAWGSGFGQSGIHLHLTSSQTGAVNISTTPGSGRGPIAIYNITIDAGAGAFTFGGPSSSDLLDWVARPTGAIHQLINNSTNPATLTPWIRYLAGGGAVWTMAFGGTGNWQCHSYLNGFDTGNRIIVNGPGTVIWNPTGFLGGGSFASPIVINGGKLVLQNPHPRLNHQAITLNGNFEFNLTNAAAVQTLSGILSGTGAVTVVSGTLILAGTNSYSGATTIAGGKLVFRNARTGSGDITVADGAILGVTATNTQVTPGILTLGTGGGATLEFNNVNSPNTPVIAATTLVSAGAITVNINSGTFAPGQNYPLLTWASGSAPTVALGAPSGFSGGLTVIGNTLFLNVNSVLAPTLQFVRAGNQLQFSWANGFGSFRLQAQTNNLNVGVSNNWADYPGGGTTPVTVPMSPAEGTVFYRLISSHEH